MSLDLAGHIAWGGAELGAAMSIHTSPNPRAVLSFDLFLPLTAECNLEFRISAAASLATDPNSPFGIAGSFSFGDTYFNTEVFGCLVSAIGTAVSEFWTELINGWLTGAGDFFTLLADAAAAVTALLYVNPNGQCIFFFSFGIALCSTINGDVECVSNDAVPGSGPGGMGCNGYCTCDRAGCGTCRCVADGLTVDQHCDYLQALPPPPSNIEGIPGVGWYPDEVHHFDPPGCGRNCASAGAAVTNTLSDVSAVTVGAVTVAAGAVADTAEVVGTAVSDTAVTVRQSGRRSQTLGGGDYRSRPQ